MKLYEVRANVKGFQKIIFNRLDSFRKIVDLCSTGKPITKKELPTDGQIFNNDYKGKAHSISDCMFLSNNCLVFSKNAVDTLEKYIKDYVDIIPFRCLNYSEDIYLINCYYAKYILDNNCVGAYTVVSEKNQSIEEPWQPEFGTKIPWLHKIKDTIQTRVNCTEDFIDFVREKKLTGFWFSRIV